MLRPGRGLRELDRMVIQEVENLRAMEAKLDIFMRYMDESWILIEEKDQDGYVIAWRFKPTWLTPELSQEHLFKHGERFVLMSATFPSVHVLSMMLGVNKEDIQYLELPSTFPAGNRPVYLRPVANMSYRTKHEDLPKLLEGIRDVLRKHPKEKGLIHTHKWELNDQVMAIGDTRLITHTRNGNGKEEEIRQFLSSKNGVFASPSSSRGLDLPDDACRFIILAKAPYMDMKDKLVSSRYYTPGGIGRHWYQFMAAQDIVQASGRGVRHPIQSVVLSTDS
jgi:Rad3-related DNA helicase